MNAIFRRLIGPAQYLLLAFCFVSCDLIEYHPYDLESRNQSSNLNLKSRNILKESEDNEDTERFMFMGDTQRDFD